MAPRTSTHCRRRNTFGCEYAKMGRVKASGAACGAVLNAKQNSHSPWRVLEEDSHSESAVKCATPHSSTGARRAPQSAPSGAGVGAAAGLSCTARVAGVRVGTGASRCAQRGVGRAHRCIVQAGKHFLGRRGAGGGCHLDSTGEGAVVRAGLGAHLLRRLGDDSQHGGDGTLWREDARGVAEKRGKQGKCPDLEGSRLRHVVHSAGSGDAARGDHAMRVSSAHDAVQAVVRSIRGSAGCFGAQSRA